MKTMQQWFDAYALSHQNKTNQKIHFICVPAIFFSIIGLLMSIPTHFLQETLQLNNPFIENWAFLFGILLLIFYFRLSIHIFVKMLVLIMICIYVNYFISTTTSLLYFSLSIFILAWIGQFYGHKIEGAKPSFLNDIKFLLIGPAWVFHKISLKINSVRLKT